MAQAPNCDVRVVRSLAERVAERAQSDEYEARRKRWRDVNALRKPDRAPVWCRPAGVWRELIPGAAIACTEPALRAMEVALRRHLYKDAVGDDHIFEAWWGVPAVWRCSTGHVWGLETGKLIATTDRGGWQYERPIATERDYERVTVPEFTYDHEATEAAASWADDTLGDILPVRIECSPPLGPSTLNTSLEQLRGMSAFMLDLAVAPHLVHRLMAKLQEGVLRALRVAEESGRLTLNTHSPMLESEPLRGKSGDTNEVRLCPPISRVVVADLWGVANSQEFQEVSPAMLDEFLLNYQIPVLQQFGASQYGCCEDLSCKIPQVLRIPNLRVFVSSAWTDLDEVIAACGHKCAIMWRQRATDVVFPDDLLSIERHLDEGMRKLHGHYYQVVLRELETLASHPNRLHEWATLAIRLAEKHA